MRNFSRRNKSATLDITKLRITERFIFLSSRGNHLTLSDFH